MLTPVMTEWQQTQIGCSVHEAGKCGNWGNGATRTGSLGVFNDATQTKSIMKKAETRFLKKILKRTKVKKNAF